MTVRVATPPAFKPVTRSQAKLWCRIDDDITDQDAVIDMLISAMTDYAEHLTGRAFIQRGLQLIEQGWKTVCLGGVEYDGFELPQAPLVSVESIHYLDTDGVDQVLSTSLYDVHIDREPGVIVRAYQQTWPTVRMRPNGVKVNYTAGYVYGSPSAEADQQSALPDNLKLWLHARLATLYENREQLMANNQIQIPRDFCDGLLDNLVLGSRVA